MCIVSTAAATAAGISASYASAAAAVANVAFAASAVAGIAQAGIGIANSQAQSDAAQKRADYEVQIAQYESRLAQQRGDAELVRNGIAARRAYGRQLASTAASNLSIGFGSAGELLEETRRFQSLDQSTIAANTKTEVLGIQLGAESSRFEGGVASAAGDIAVAGGALSLTASAADSATGAFRARRQLKYGREPLGPGSQILSGVR